MESAKSAHSDSKPFLFAFSADCTVIDSCNGIMANAELSSLRHVRQCLLSIPSARWWRPAALDSLSLVQLKSLPLRGQSVLSWGGRRGAEAEDEFSAVDLKAQPAADWRFPAAAALVIRVVLELGTNSRACPRLFVCGSAVAWALASNPGFASARG